MKAIDFYKMSMYMVAIKTTKICTVVKKAINEVKAL